MSVDVRRGQALREHQHLHVVEQLRDLLGGLVVDSYSAAIHTSAASSTIFLPIAWTPASSRATVPDPRDGSRPSRSAPRTARRTSSRLKVTGSRARCVQLDAEQVDHEDQRASGQLVAAARGAVGQVRRTISWRRPPTRIPGMPCCQPGDQAARAGSSIDLPRLQEEIELLARSRGRTPTSVHVDRGTGERLRAVAHLDVAL